MSDEHNFVSYCQLAERCIEKKQLEEAAAAYNNALAIAPDNATAHLHLGYVYERLGQGRLAAQLYSLAADLDPSLLFAWQSAEADQQLRKRSQRGDICLRQHLTGLHRAAVEAVADKHPRADLSRVEQAIWCQTHPTNYAFDVYKQEPTEFYVRGLDRRPVYTPTDRKWLRTLARSTEVITGEVRACLDAFGPMDAWPPLVHLYRDGALLPGAEKAFAETLRLLGSMPMRMMKDGPRLAYLSILAGHFAQPPCFGASNAVMNVCLPLIVPGVAGIRVGDVSHEWKAGEPLAYDMSFENESWNHSDFGMVALMFEVWHPSLRKAECEAIALSKAIRDEWMMSRTSGL